MFERLSPKARQVMVEAQSQARLLGQDQIGTEHILLGLLAVGGVGVAALQGLGLSLEEVGQRATEAGRGPHGALESLPFTKQVQEALGQALREALRLNHNWISTGHLLLGLLEVRQCGAARILSDLGLRASTARAEVARLVDSGQTDEQPPVLQGAAAPLPAPRQRRRR
jgi:ATP-dependent Clp protease ATP-binding subunit ClpA